MNKKTLQKLKKSTAKNCGKLIKNIIEEKIKTRS